MKTHAEDLAEWKKMKVLARRILAGELSAYREALGQFNELAEISDLGSSIEFTIHGAKVAACGLKVNGLQSIPAEQKTLNAAGKLSVKPMPKARFHEIYQDYVCGCVLRVLHNAFDDLRINKVNYRKEFFRLPLERIKSLVTDKGLNAAFTLVAESHEYRETKALEKMTHEERGKYHLRRANGEDILAE